MHQSSFEKMRAFRVKYLEPLADRPLAILDVGSLDVNGSYRPLFDGPRWTYTGADVAAGPNVDLVLTAPYRWRQLRAESFDVVVSGQAFEHIEYIWLTILEIARVLKPGGLCCLLAPSAGVEHRYPVDCWRFYPDGFRALARWARLEVLEAATQWDSHGYPDGSDQWHDTLLVARKPVYSRWRALQRRVKTALYLALLRRAA
jgi:SAM-dependent methyltransferase